MDIGLYFVDLVNNIRPAGVVLLGGYGRQGVYLVGSFGALGGVVLVVERVDHEYIDACRHAEEVCS